MARDVDLEEDELLDDDSGKGSGADSDEQLPENATEEVRRGPIVWCGLRTGGCVLLVKVSNSWVSGCGHVSSILEKRRGWGTELA